MRFVFTIIILMLFPATVYASMPLTATSAVLIDQNEGTVLFAQNEHARMYPAGLTKMLTALVALEYLDPEQVIVVGSEINAIPRGALMAGHQVGEHITVHNLLRGLMIRNGNDSGAVLALQTAQAERRREGIPYPDAERVFAIMMNNFARELGARNTYFVNPNGLHNDRHVSTAYDLALIARAFMENPLLREIAGETEFEGNSLGDLYIEGAHTIDHHWVDTNELMTGGMFHYHYATGIRSGTTTQASDCLAASAERRGVRLIAVVLESEDPGRWQDARMLFDYGFSNYTYHTILEPGIHKGTAFISNAMLGEPYIMDVYSAEGFTLLLNPEQVSRIEWELIFDEEFVDLEAEPGGDYIGVTSLVAPIEEGEPIGRVVYRLDGRVIFETEVLAAATAYERTLDTDMDFYLAMLRENIFSMRALPLWLGGAGVLIGIVGVTLAISERRRSNRSWYGGK